MQDKNEKKTLFTSHKIHSAGNFIVKLSNEADFPVLFRNIFTAGENRYVIWSASFFPWRNLCNSVKPNMRDNSLLITKVDSFFITAFVVVSRKNG